MPRLADIADATLRAELAEAEQLLDADQFREAVERCADVYLRVMRQHPELVPPPMQEGPGITFGFARGGPGGGPGARPAGMWPVGLGLRIVFDEEKQPQMTYEKERFNFSEASTYFEFTLDLVVRAQRAATA